MPYDYTKYDDDDGRVICPMDVPGMPGYDRRRRREARAERQANGEAMTARETWQYIKSSLGAALLVLLVVGGALILFIFILWLRFRVPALP
ncbi:MAG: hypothetical protein FWF10_03010 [Clostridiales bacterium]|nr:hypothetical protein [Clostridiales bacterium]